MLFAIYKNSNFSSEYKLHFLLNGINNKIIKYTNISLNPSGLPIYFKSLVRSTYLKIIGVDVEIFEISINQSNSMLLEQQRKIRLDSRVYAYANTNDKINLKDKFNAEAIYKKKKYKIKIRIKGDRSTHYASPFETSLRIDLRGNQRLLGMEEFSIHKPYNRNYTHELIFHKLMQQVGNLSPKYGIIKLYYNGHDRGIYAFEESFTKELIERNFRRNGPIYSTDEQYGIFYPNIIYKTFSEKKWIDENKDILTTGYSILNAIKAGNTEISHDNFDLDSWAKYFALVDLSGSHHGLLAKSVRLYLNPTTGKFEPISFDGHQGTGNDNLINNFIILDLLFEDTNCVGNYFCNEKKWIYKFFKNLDNTNKMDFIELYIKYLNDYSEVEFIDKFYEKNEKEIIKFNNAVYSEFSKTDEKFGKGFNFFNYEKKHLYERAKLIKQKLKNNLNSIVSSVDKEKLKLVSTLNVLPFKILSDCTHLKNKYISLEKSKIKTINLKNNCSFIKAAPFLGQSLVINLNENLSLSNEKITNYKNFSRLGDILNGINNESIFYPVDKIIYINENLYIPKNQTIKFSKGQKIYFKENTMIYSEGNIFFNGSIDKPIFLEGSKSNAIVQYGQNFSAKNLVIKNLNPPKFKNRIFYSGLNIIKSNVTFDNVIFKNITGEDAINLIDSKTFFKNVNFKNISSDAVDVDYGKFIFDKIICQDINNDCLDISGATVSGKHLFGKNVKDKVLSAGEKSSVKIFDFFSKDSRIGIVAKDNSIVHLFNGEINNNYLAVASFVKKKNGDQLKFF